MRLWRLRESSLSIALYQRACLGSSVTIGSIVAITASSPKHLLCNYLPSIPLVIGNWFVNSCHVYPFEYRLLVLGMRLLGLHSACGVRLRALLAMPLLTSCFHLVSDC
jgi:hypothetical protein